MKAYHVKISGRVQGVWFRARTQEEAVMLGVKGWVRNLPDGSVEVFMQGQQDRVDALLSWCYKGPAGALVTGVDYRIAEIDESITGFRIRH